MNFSITINSLILVLFKLFIASVFFDSIIANSVFSVFSSFKYLFLLCIFLIAIVGKVKFLNFELFNKAYLLFFIYYIFLGIISIPGFIELGLTGFQFYKQFFFTSIFFYIFYNYKYLTGQSFKQLLTYITHVAVLFVVVNTLLYMVPLPIWGGNFHPWWGRISQGYPTIDVVNLAISLTIVVFFDQLSVTPFRRAIYSITLILGIVELVSGTGFALLIIIFVGFLFFLFFNRGSNEASILKKNFLITILIASLAGILLLVFISQKNPILYNQLLQVGENRISGLVGEKSRDMDVNTMDIRQEEFEFSRDHFIRTGEDLVFGVGYANVNYETSRRLDPTHYIYVEDQLSLNLITGGYLGTALFYIFILSVFVEITIAPNLTFNRKMLYLVSIAVIALSTYTSIPFHSFPIMVIFAAVYGGLKHNIKFSNI